jgi:hypothetical protein
MLEELIDVINALLLGVYLVKGTALQIYVLNAVMTQILL